MTRIALALVCLFACERVQPDDRREPPAPVKPDPIRDARAQFELLAGADAERAPDSVFYARGDLLGGWYDPRAGDVGDFIGRLRALFGPVPGDDYVLRDRATRVVVVAHARNGEPMFVGGTWLGDAAELARERAAGSAHMAADPVLQGPLPTDLSTPEQATWSLHMSDAYASPALQRAVRRLDALVEAVPPADWDRLEYSADQNTVDRVGARRGSSFDEELPPDQGMAYVLEVAERASGDDLVSAGAYALHYYFWHAADLAAYTPRVRAQWERYAQALVATNDDADDADARAYRAAQIANARAQAHALGIDTARAGAILRAEEPPR